MLSTIETLPLDVHLQLFSFMQPHDMLHLARTSRPMFRLLCSQSVNASWRSAIQEMDAYNDVPPYPQWIPGLKLTGLLYGNMCSLCGETSNSTVILFTIVKRVCMSCSSGSPVFITDSKVKKMLKPDSKLAVMIGSMLTEIQPRPGVMMDSYQRKIKRNGTVRYLYEVIDVIAQIRTAKSQPEETLTKLRAERSAEVARRDKLQQRWHTWLNKERERQELDFHARLAKHADASAWASALRNVDKSSRLISNSSFPELDKLWPQLFLNPGRLTDREFEDNVARLATVFEQKKQAPGMTLRRRLELELDGLVNAFQFMHKGSVVMWGYQRREDVHQFFVNAGKTPEQVPTAQHMQQAHVLAARICWTVDIHECKDEACAWTMRDIGHAKAMDTKTAADMPFE